MSQQGVTTSDRLHFALREFTLTLKGELKLEYSTKFSKTAKIIPQIKNGTVSRISVQTYVSKGPLRADWNPGQNTKNALNRWHRLEQQLGRCKNKQITDDFKHEVRKLINYGVWKSVGD